MNRLYLAKNQPPHEKGIEFDDCIDSSDVVLRCRKGSTGASKKDYDIIAWKEFQRTRASEEDYGKSICRPIRSGTTKESCKSSACKERIFEFE